MNIMNVVSETALITLRSRVIESMKVNPIMQDQVGAQLLENITLHLPEDIKQRILNRHLSPVLSAHIALRSRKYDLYVKEFLQEHPDGLVVSLGSGFDTRYWRISSEPWKYVEIDFEDVIEAKKELLKDKLDYTTIGCSVLDEQWIGKIQAMQNKQVLFLAEGLFMYLPQHAVENLFKKLSDTFSESSIVFETINKKYTSGIWKKMVEGKMKRSAGTDAGTSYQFGVNNGKEVESFGENMKLLEEWSYFEDMDIKPKILRHFRNMKYFTRTQWTIKAAIG